MANAEVSFADCWGDRWSKVVAPKQLPPTGVVRRLDVGSLLGKTEPKGTEAMALVDGIVADLKSVLQEGPIFWSPASGLVDVFYPKLLPQAADLKHAVVRSTVDRRVRDTVAALAKPPPPKPAQQARRIDWDDFQIVCRKSQARPEQVQRIDVSELVLGMPDPKARLSRRSWRIVDEILDEFLVTGGYSTRYPGNQVMLFFPGLSASLSGLKCRTISREIERRAGAVSRRSGDAESEIETEADDSPEPPAPKTEEEDAPEDAEEVKKLNKAFAALASASRGAPAAETEHAAQPEISFTSVPVWRAGNQTLVGHTLRASDGSDAPEAAPENLDLPLLAHAQADILGRGEGQSPYLVIVPLHWRTIEKTTSRSRYLQLASRIPEEVRRYIVVSLYGIPEDLLTIRVGERVQELRKSCRALMCQVDISRRDFDQLRGLGFHGIGIDLQAGSGVERDVMPAMDAFLDALAPLQVKSFINNLNSKSLVIAALAAGFDYLSGAAIADAGENRGVRAFSIPDLYS